jgi:hypothetical protein
MLAGALAQRNHRNRVSREYQPRSGDGLISVCRRSGAGSFQSHPAVPPPTNFPHPSGTKTNYAARFFRFCSDWKERGDRTTLICFPAQVLENASNGVSVPPLAPLTSAW